jgi:hypothetical protein
MRGAAALFRLARPAVDRLLSLRFMRFSMRKCVAFSVCACLIVICSCEKHPLGEMPEVQREEPDLAAAQDKNPSPTGVIPASPAPSAKPTPAEFFPATTPR